MRYTISIQNFRRFTDNSPASITIDDGITCLVGPNNAGKSSLVRMLFTFRSIFDQLRNPNWMQDALGGTARFNYGSSIADTTEVFAVTNDRPLRISIDLHDVAKAPPGYVAPDGLAFIIDRAQPQRVKMEVRSGRVTVASKYSIQMADDVRFISHEGVKIAIDALLEAGVDLSDSIYIGPFRNVINIGGHNHYYDIDIGEQFLRRWRTYKTGAEKRTQQAAIRLEDSIAAIFGYEHFAIDASDDEKSLQFRIDDWTGKDTEVGSGLTQFVITLVSAAVREPRFILIDEPELGLHPRLQVEFATTLGSFAKRGMVIATHNLGLARSIAERIYTVRPIDRSQSVVRDYAATDNLVELLGELSFADWRDNGGSSVLLVEGKTDVKTVKQLLMRVRKAHDVVVVSMGGSDLVNAKSEHELAELAQLASDVYVLIDSERKSADAELSSDRQSFVAMCDSLGMNCHVLDRRALENYLPQHAVDAAFGSGTYEALGPFDEPTPPWGKIRNWRVAVEMKQQDIVDTDLGQFLESIGQPSANAPA